MADPVVRDTLKPSEARGGIVHSFPADASPEEKAASAGKGRSALQSNLPSSNNHTNDAGPREVALDTSTQGPPVQPTITVEDFDKATAEETDRPEALNGEPMPGALAGPAPAIPDWYKVGWRAVSGVDKPIVEGEERDKGILAAYISDAYYGEWYHNAGIIFFAVGSTYFLTLFHMGWGWLFIVLAACATYYSNSIERVRRAARDDIQRELIKNRLATEHESADWINNFLDRFWLIYEPILSATIVSSVDQILSVSTPPFLDSIRLSTFTLGMKAPRIDRVRTFPRTADDVVLMDWGLSFTSTDTVDLAPNQRTEKTSSKIVLEIRVGKGLATAAMPILVENIEFRGDLRIKMKLVNNFPHVQIVEISFLSKPIFDYVLKPLGGETFGFDINSIPGLGAFIRDTVHATLGPMMYDPNVFTLNLEQLLSGTPLDTAVGVLQVQIISARNLQGAKLGGGTPDPYISLSINQRSEIAKTKYKHSSLNPHFGSTHYVLVNQANLNETLTLTAMDYNDHRKDTELGTASFELNKLMEDATQEGIVSKILKDGKDRGELLFNVSYFPVLQSTKLEGGVIEPVPDTKVGIVRLVVHQAKELDSSKSMSRDANPLAKVLLGRQVVHTTPTYKHTIMPVWESPTEFLVSDKSASVITVKVIDDRDIMKDPVIGYLSVKLEDLLKAKEQGKDWFPLSGAKSGKIRLSAEWKPLGMAGSIQGASIYSPPIGVIRLWVKKATDVKNVEAALGGKSDPYLRVLLNNITMARTEVVNNNLNPEWDQIVYVPVHSLHETLVLEVMDYQNLTKDRPLGYCELKVKEMARENVDNPKYPFQPTGKREASDPIRLQGNTFKGQLHYVAEFIPAFNLRGLEFEDTDTELDGQNAATAGSGDDVSDATSVSSSDEEMQAVPEGITIRSDSPKKHHHVRKMGSIDTTNSVGTTQTTQTSNTTNTTPSPPEQPGFELSREEIFKAQSGVLILNVLSGSLYKKGRLEFLFDDASWPSFSTEKARSTTAKWNQVGEGFVKELDFGQIRIRLNENEEGMKDDIVGELKIMTKDFLDQCFNKEAEFTLTTDDGDRRVGTIRILAKYVPVPVTLEPRESINNMGLLRVDLVDARDLMAADRGGKSDPYAVFTLNDQKVFKSETKKKTLSPVWEENFVVMVPSRVAAAFNVEIFDWDRVGQAESLGEARIELADLEPFTSKQLTLPLSHKKHGQRGEVRLRLVFNPEVVARSRKPTSTFSAAGRAMTQVGGIPFGAGRGIAHGVGNAGTKARGLFKRDKSGSFDSQDGPFPTPVPEPPSGQVSQPADGYNLGPDATHSTFPAFNTAMPAGQVAPPREPGSLRVIVLGAKDLVGAQAGESVKPYVVLRLGEKEAKTKHVGKTVTPEWDEQFTFTAGPETSKMSATILDHKSFGRDKTLGEADIDIWRHIQISGTSPITAADVWVELREGAGLLHLRLEFSRQRTNSTLGAAASASTASLGQRSPLSSPSRFSIGKRHVSTNNQDD